MVCLAQSRDLTPNERGLLMIHHYAFHFTWHIIYNLIDNESLTFMRH